MKRTANLSVLALVAVLGLAVAGCSSGGGAQVASLSGTTKTTTASSGQATEEEVLKWVQCMRDQGLDIADPTVDSNGNLVLGRPGGFGGAGGSSSTTVAGSTTDQTRPDPSKFQGATAKCGQPPRTGGGFSDQDRQAAQDNLLEMAQCLRDQGLDVADPDFSAQGPGGSPPTTASGSTATTTAQGQGGPRRGPFGDLAQSDPKVQAAFDTCRAKLGNAFPGGPGARSNSSTTAAQ